LLANFFNSQLTTINSQQFFCLLKVAKGDMWFVVGCLLCKLFLPLPDRLAKLGKNTK